MATISDYPKKILIIGESNSVGRDGWIQGLSLFLPNSEIINHSIGSTGIFNSIRILEGIKNGEYQNLIEGVDLLVIDSFIQDSLFFSKDECLYKNLIGYVLGSFNKNLKCQIAYLAFEPLNIDEPIKKLKNNLFENCLNHKVIFYDVKNFLIEHALRNNIEISEMFSDSSHPKKEFSALMGYDFATNLNKNLKLSDHSIEKDESFKSNCIFLS